MVIKGHKVLAYRNHREDTKGSTKDTNEITINYF
jgi:hypothetical protein